MAQVITNLRAVASPAAESGYRGFAPSSASSAPRATPPKALSALVQTATAASNTPSATAAANEAQPSREAVEQAVEDLSRQFESNRTNLQFRLDDDSGRMIVSIVDARDGTVLRQLPSEVALRIARSIEEFKAHLVEEVA